MSSSNNATKPKKEHKREATGFLKYLLEYRRNEADKGILMKMNDAQEQAGKIWMVIS